MNKQPSIEYKEKNLSRSTDKKSYSYQSAPKQNKYKYDISHTPNKITNKYPTGTLIEELT